MNKRFFILAVALVGVCSSLWAQKQRLTNREILEGKYNSLINRMVAVPVWVDNNVVSVALESEVSGGRDRFYSVKDGKYYSSLPQGSNSEHHGVDRRISFRESLAKVLREVGLEMKDIQNPTHSPNGKMAAYTLGGNLYVADLEDNTIKQLTTDGSNVVYNGYASWVYYEEILGRSSNYKAFWWSPDSKQIDRKSVV